ncbi:polysaccharide biosynthesis tyrosine autokinase [Alloiococcus sp. CFN-8]|uniref:polysaccharide biosynthesis tyrosine autokinase n=1 Tax=Alloiococcus sp. CFN-8 TaxID=3416081 RepID=UPI003CF21BC6
MNDNNYNKEDLIDITNIIETTWKAIKKLWWLVLALIIFFSVISFFRASNNYIPYYEASTTFTITVDESSSYYNRSAAEQLGSTFPYIISSTVLNDLIAEDLGLAYVPASISASVVESTNLFTLRVTGSEPEMVYKVLQSTIENYPKVSEFVVGTIKMDILEESGVPSEPNNTRRQHSIGNVKSGALKGAALGSVIIIFYVVTRNTIKKPEDLTRRLNINHIGSIPEIASKKRRKKVESNISIEGRKVSQEYIEAIRTVRTRIERESMKKNHKTILVTSALAKEGKTTTAYNIALSLIMKGKSVALIDCDLRHPSIMNIIGLSEEGIGLTEYLKGEAHLSKCFIRRDDINFYIMSAGKGEEASAELLSSKKMKDLIDLLKDKVDYIILDTAPVGILADTSIIAGYTDAAVYVVKQDHAKVHSILEGVERLSESNIDILGFVLNGVKEDIVRYGYGSYGRYGKYGKYGSYGRYGKYAMNYSKDDEE